MSRMLVAAITVALLSPALSAAESEPVLELDALIEAVLAAHPDLRAFAAEAEGREAAAEAAGSLPDPMLGVRLNDLGTSFSRRQDMMSMREVMARQRLPWPGKRDLRREVQSLLSDAARHGRDDQAVALVEATTAAYADLWLAMEARRVFERQRATLRQLVDLAEVRYEALAVSLSDPLRAELALVRIEAPLADLDEREATARAILAALLDTPRTRLVGTPAAPPAVSIPDDPEALLAGIGSHPALQEVDGRRESRLAAARLAEREVFPDVDVGLFYGQRDGAHDMIGVEVMAPLPLFGQGRRASEAEAARAEARALEARRAARQADLIRDARAAHASAVREGRIIKLYEEAILPRARENVDAATAAYESGDVDFLTLLDAQLQVYDHELDLLRAQAAQVRSAARLNRALGRSTHHHPE